MEGMRMNKIWIVWPEKCNDFTGESLARVYLTRPEQTETTTVDWRGSVITTRSWPQAVEYLSEGQMRTRFGEGAGLRLDSFPRNNTPVEVTLTWRPA